MKIAILPIADIFRPILQPFIYPKHNKDYGVEQDFLKFLGNNQEVVVKDYAIADWHYLPVFWTRWHLNHDYAKTGLKILQKEVHGAIIDSQKTFTICQYDDGPVVNLGKTKILYASRKKKSGSDIPLLSAPHKIPLLKPSKKYLGVFSGRITTHPIRKELINACGANNQFLVHDSDTNTKSYVKDMLSGYVALCPRGYGGSSFRFYEAMQLGVVPFLIGDIDTRPFKNQIDWKQISFYAKKCKDIRKIIESVPKKELLEMGLRARKVFYEKLQYGKWPELVLKELQ